jgi:integral membrane protein (TIGR01906 family)
MNQSSAQKGFSWFVALLVPVALVLGVVRLLLTPAFLRFEYSLPNFPPDTFGFSQQDRLYWAQFAVDYLLNSEDISYLGDLRFENGQPLYNQRELSHMVDVKVTMGVALKVWYAALLLLVGLGLGARWAGWWNTYLLGMRRGSWLTVFTLATIILLVILSFGVLFVAFHNVFFQPGTWTFQFSDTLIRLFPERFWRDIFVYVGVLSVGSALLLIYIFRPRVSRGLGR